MDQLVSAIKELRSELGDSQQAFANRLSLSARAVANYESGRHPTRAVLWSLAMLADQSNNENLAKVFWRAYSAVMKGVLGPVTDEESAWVRMMLALLRNRTLVPDLTQLGESLLAALATVVSKIKAIPGVDCEDLEEALLWARNHIAPTGEQKVKQLAIQRSKQTGEPFATSYLQTLIGNPELYSEIQKELGYPSDVTLAGVKAGQQPKASPKKRTGKRVKK
jgi:transcriptional regulator with XRE-family HTH domain